MPLILGDLQGNLQTEKGMEKGQLLAETQEKILSTTIKEITPFGNKLEFNLAGQVAGALYAGQHIETANVLLKNDGTLEGEFKAIETTKEGDVLVFSAKGVGKQTGISTASVEIEALILTQSKRLAQLNNSWIRIDGTADFGAGDVRLKYYKL